MRNWNLTRILRILTGTAFVFAGWNDQSWLVAIAGGLLLVQGALNLNCFFLPFGQCEVNSLPETDKKS